MGWDGEPLFGFTDEHLLQAGMVGTSKGNSARVCFVNSWQCFTHLWANAVNLLTSGTTDQLPSEHLHKLFPALTAFSKCPVVRGWLCLLLLRPRPTAVANCFLSILLVIKACFWRMIIGGLKHRKDGGGQQLWQEVCVALGIVFELALAVDQLLSTGKHVFAELTCSSALEFVTGKEETFF